MCPHDKTKTVETKIVKHGLWNGMDITLIGLIYKMGLNKALRVLSGCMPLIDVLCKRFYNFVRTLCELEE